MNLRFVRSCVGACVLPILFAGMAAAAEDDGFRPIFDGKSLEGWDGNPDLWRVEDGAITGQTTAEKPTKGNTFLIWRGGELDDFELKLEYKIVGGNSGIQYRSFEVPNEKWVVGGYQGDFEAGDTYSGILYGERFRGILAARGQKTVIGADHKPQVAGSVGDSKEIQSKIKKEDWNEYRVTAQGYTFTHRINGVATAECVDEDKEMRRASGILALQLHAGPAMKVQFRNIRLKRLMLADNRKKVVFIAGRQSHGYGAHDHQAGCLLLAKQLNESMPNILATVYTGGWPKDPTALDNADSIVMYSDGGGGHMAAPKLKDLQAKMKEGVGLVCFHYAVEVTKGEPGDSFLAWIGGYFEMNWSVNPHWTAKFAKLPDHAITRGVKPFSINDEWYYHMRFRPGLQNVTPILTDLPPESSLSRPDGTHSGNPAVREAVLTNKEPQHVAWAHERKDGGRGFGFTGGHVHWNWGNDNFRRLALNAIVWTTGAEVPEGGVPCKPVTLEDLEANPDEPVPPNFNREAIRKMLEEWKKQ
ncbi:MAG: DUF1080 domain-containing protein [Planctomycetia bacterium]|nr:DUF1080 domain-containing protein [Planctomycetia bacterium]